MTETDDDDLRLSLREHFKAHREAARTPRVIYYFEEGEDARLDTRAPRSETGEK